MASEEEIGRVVIAPDIILMSDRLKYEMDVEGSGFP